jgi:hypothetical protein
MPLPVLVVSTRELSAHLPDSALAVRGASVATPGRKSPRCGEVSTTCASLSLWLAGITGATADRYSPFPPVPPMRWDMLHLSGRLAGIGSGLQLHRGEDAARRLRQPDLPDRTGRTLRSLRLFGGGNFAFRTARELERRGKASSAVVMLDASRFVKRFDFRSRSAPAGAKFEFVGAEGVQPFLKNPVLKDR